MAAAVVAALLKAGARRRRWSVLAAAVGVALLLTLTSLSAPLSRDARDVQLRLIAPGQPSNAVVVFDIDDASLAELKPYFGTWPFKRDVYALVVEQLRDLGARAIAIDLLLADSAEGDAALARVQARGGAPVVLAAAGLRHASDARRGVRTGSTAAAGVPSHAWPSLALPAPSVWPEGRPPRLGVITSPLDEDGVLRALPLWHHDAQQTLPVMPWAVHLALKGPEAARPALDRNGGYHFAMPAAPAWPPVHRFADLALLALGQGADPSLREAVAGRIVFIGSSALLADAVMTPQGQVSGTVALAQATAALAEGPHVRPPSRALDAGLVLLALLPAAYIVWRGRPSPRHDAAATGVVFVAIVAAALWALFRWHQPSEWITPLATLATAWAASVVLHQRGQAAARRRLLHELEVSEEAARAKSAFLANVSHEIRTPLNALLGVADLLAQTELTPRQRLHVQVFRESGQTLLALINDLLDLSRIEAGRLELHPAPFDLPQALTQLATLMRIKADDKGLNLVLDLADDVPTGVLGDRLRLEQALMNLVGNAIKFTARGSVRLAVLPDPQVPGMLRFDVIDTGIGIAADKLGVIFEPFAQADGSITRLFGGTGLGLSITRSIAHLMGGSLQVQSAPGVGSTFTLRLPLRPAALRGEAGEDTPSAAAAAPHLPPTTDQGDRSSQPGLAAAAPAAHPAPAAPDRSAAPGDLQALQAPASRPRAAPAGGAPLSVLLAEDNEVNVYLFRNMLEGEALAIDFAADGHEALERLRRQRYDIAFIDVQMPGLDGLSVTRALRTLESGGGRPRTPVVALTANAFSSDARASLDAGCDRHLTKPYSRQQLIEAIQQLAAPLAPPPPSRTPSALEVLHDSVLDRSGAIERLGGDAALYQRLALQAASFMREWPESFALACRSGDDGQAFRLAHDLRSIASSVGALAVAEQAGMLEQLLRTRARAPETGASTPDGNALEAPAAIAVLDGAASQRTMALLPPVIEALSRDA